MKPELSEYSKWLKDNFAIDIYSTPSSIYELVIHKLKVDFEKSLLWKDFLNNLLEYNDEYYLNNGYQLLKIESIPVFTKSFESVVNKTYRKNILQNENFPNAPINEWILPENWFVKVKDLLRTTLTVKYLDGVEFIANKIELLSKKYGYSFYVDYEAREEGYYAAHITIEGKFKIVDETWSEKEILFPIEIQITTQLQEVIKGLLHKMYEEIRTLPETDKNVKWQWDYKSKEFSSNYLGHILHYVEGMILEVRDKQKINSI